MSENENETDITRLLMEDFDAGAFGRKLARAVSLVAVGTSNNPRKKGKVTVTLNFNAIDAERVEVSHTLDYVKPTTTGASGDRSTTSTPLYIGPGGKLTLTKPNQGQLFTMDGQPSHNKGA